MHSTGPATSGLPEAASVRAELVREIIAAHDCSDAAVLAAMDTVPREAFVPAYFVSNGDGRLHLLRRADDTSAWLRTAYSDRVLATQLDGTRHADDADPAEPPCYGVATCSASQPSLMAGMLELLDLSPGLRVLEIGVGTGYNAALLCELVGDENVVSIEYDPVLADKAASRLAATGYRPTVLTGDGTTGVPQSAPFDRIIATCSFQAVPAPWLEQTRPGGVIVVNLMPRIPAGILGTFAIVGPTTAIGRISPAWTCFMPTRAQPPEHAISLLDVADIDQAPLRKTALRWADVRSADGLYALAALTIPAYHVTAFDEQGAEQAWLLADDGSAACQQGGYVAQSGPRALWTELEAVAATWLELGRPRRTGFELSLTVTDGHVHCTVMHPQSGWTMP